MKTLLNTELAISIQITEDMGVEDVLTLVKEEGGKIGKVSLRNVLNGTVPMAGGFELIETEETEVKKPEVKPVVVVVADVDAGELAGELAEMMDLVAGAGEQPMSGTVTPEGEAEAEGEAEGEAPVVEAGSIAAMLIGKDGKVDKTKDVKPDQDTGVTRRRHTKKEEALIAARDSSFGVMIKQVEALGLTLNYVNPDHKWFELAFNATISNPEKITRKDAYLDIAPTKNGGFGFSFYVDGKSQCKRIKVPASATPAETLAELVASVTTAMASWNKEGLIK
ncbi:hypothetical protein NVP1244A_177 [Vibrio phage 1.244.A._10N.261.54.C3]|nr:hypothetical protein NVP1244A_177 [Vibrio phage 1.244.A._10N.261.54.C3]AUR98805.1 hypothetical protein NVP1255O_177 [Vibrio phage 1.255.O._10N.286.45.F1]